MMQESIGRFVQMHKTSSSREPTPSPKSKCDLVSHYKTGCLLNSTDFTCWFTLYADTSPEKALTDQDTAESHVSAQTAVTQSPEEVFQRAQQLLKSVGGSSQVSHSCRGQGADLYTEVAFEEG